MIDGVTSNLTKLYVYPDVAAKMNTYVQARAQHGDYNNITSGAVFADALTKDLRAVSNDRHLHVDYAPFKQPVTAPHEQPSPDDLNRMRQQMADNNCGFEKAEILPRNIGYLKFNMFGPPAICAPTASAAMNLLAHTRALIIDLRDNGGGDPAMVDFIVSYLFDTHEHINDLYNRSDNETTQYWTLPWVPGERLTTQPVYVLTSHGTFSGAEEFTYDLKNLKRATIVGETTGGGAHPVRGSADRRALRYRGARRAAHQPRHQNRLGGYRHHPGLQNLARRRPADSHQARRGEDSGGRIGTGRRSRPGSGAVSPAYALVVTRIERLPQGQTFPFRTETVRVIIYMRETSQELWLHRGFSMAYSDKVVDHYEHPRNVGTLDKSSSEVGTGLVGAPECGDVMRLQIKVNPETQVIEDAKFKTFGCGSAIASSSLATEWVKGKTVEDALKISNTDIVKELSLPPVKIHCSVLAEDAIRAAIGDWKKKNNVAETQAQPLLPAPRPPLHIFDELDIGFTKPGVVCAVYAAVFLLCRAFACSERSRHGLLRF